VIKYFTINYKSNC